MTSIGVMHIFYCSCKKPICFSCKKEKTSVIKKTASKIWFFHFFFFRITKNHFVMEIKYVNPYSFIGANYNAGMDAIAAALAPLYPNQTLDDLVNAVYNYVEGAYFPTPPDSLLIVQTLKSNIYAAINGYLNVQSGAYMQFNSEQMHFVFQLLEGAIDCKNPEDLRRHIMDVEERITISDLSATEQMPLLYATEIGKTAYSYWANIISMPPPANNWTNFITSFTPAIVKFPFWVASSMEGTLIALSMYARRDERLSEIQLMLKLTENIGGNIVQALFGALGVGAGKVVFKL
jgi:hypothetical protein